MIFTPLPLAGAYEVTPERRADPRGFFARLFCREEFAAQGLATDWEQSNLSHNAQIGTLRGLHFQRPPAAEIKLVRCVKGAAFDVVIDLRGGSASFGLYVGLRLDAARHNAIYVPEGFAHGFQTLTPGTELEYFHSVSHASEHEGGINPLDPDLAIDWPLPPSNLSRRDVSLPRLKDCEPL